MPKPVSAELKLDRVEAWLSDRVDLAGPLQASPITGGRSNLTYLLDDGSARFVLRRPPLGEALRGAHDITREYRIAERLQGTEVPVPTTLALCEDVDVIGAPFSVVSFVEGLTLRTPAEASRLAAAGRAELTQQFARTLAILHAVPPERSGLEVGRGDDFIARQLHVWRRQLGAEPTRPLPVMDEVATRLEASIPRQQRVAIVHGDYRLDNVIFDTAGTPLAVLDWELWTLGDPLADLGAAVAYWTSSSYELAPLGSAPTSDGTLGDRDDLVAAYVEAQGSPIDRALLGWYVAFGTWRFAAILEGVLRRHLSGAYGDDGEDGAWQRLEYVVPTLGETALQHLEGIPDAGP